jgi:hypothetical protein
MSCLRVDQIYLYLEKELSSLERQPVESHLASCVHCREAVAARARLTEAAGTLPDFEIPAATGFSLLSTTFGVLLLVTGQNLPGLFVSLIQYLWTNLKSLSMTAIKLFKLIFLSVKILFNLIDEFVEGFSTLSGMISPQARIVMVALTLLLFTTLFFVIRRRFFFGENNEK